MHLLFQVFHSNLKTAVPQSYVLETVQGGGENLIPEDLLALLYT